MPDQSNPAQTGRPARGEDRREITPDLVKKVADRVYALLREDFRRERERLRFAGISKKYRKNR